MSSATPGETTSRSPDATPVAAKTGWLFKVLAGTVALLIIISAYRVYRSSFSDSAWQAFAEITVLSIGLLSLRLVHRQLTAQTRESKAEFEWRKIQTYYQFFCELPETSINDKLYSLAVTLQIAENFKRGGSPLSDQVVEDICSDMEKNQTVCRYLDSFEGFAGAVRCGLVDEDFAFNMESGRLVRTFRVFRPLIDRKQNDNAAAYATLETLALDWEDRKNNQGRDSKERGATRKGTLG